MEKLLIICGPTATGKTKEALSLAKKLNGEILSADSRQVYRGMDIGTGKDLPKGAKLIIPWFKRFGYYKIEGIKLWGYDFVDPKHDFSVAQYLGFSKKIIDDISKRKKLPIVVGGTGLYIKAIIDGIPTASIPINRQLRKYFSKKSPAELFETLAQLDAIKAGSMNVSDRKNPRRLIRAIEIATWRLKHKRGAEENEKIQKMDTLVVGFFADKETLFKRIKKRVDERIGIGFESEIRKLLKGGVSWNDQSMTSLGYGQWKDYFDNKITINEVKNRWAEEEKKYAKRQMVWFKKDKRIRWIDVDSKNFRKELEKITEKWYKMKHVKES